MNRLEEIQKRMADIALEIEKEDADLDALTAEVEALKEERKALEEKVEKRQKLISEVANNNTLPVVKEFKEERGKTMPEVFTAASPEYRSAFFKRLAGETLTEVEERAYTHTTANTDTVLPSETVGGIWSMIEEQHTILGDITTYRTGTVIDLVKHTSIVAGDAKNVAEATANDDEENEFVKVSLSGKDFSKHVEISYALGRMNGVALEQYLTKEIADRLGAALAKEVITQINTDMDAANKALATAAAVPTWEELAKAFGTLKNNTGVTIYVNNATLYNALVGLTDTTGRPLFQPSMQAGVQGVLLGANIKLEDALADNEILIGDPKRVVGNFIQDIMIEQDKDIKRHVDIYSGYARFESLLVYPKAFAKLTVTVGA